MGKGEGAQSFNYLVNAKHQDCDAPLMKCRKLILRMSARDLCVPYRCYLVPNSRVSS